MYLLPEKESTKIIYALIALSILSLFLLSTLFNAKKWDDLKIKNSDSYLYSVSGKSSKKFLYAIIADL